MNLRRRISAPKVRRQHLIGLNESFNRGYRLRLIVRSAVIKLAGVEEVLPGQTKFFPLESGGPVLLANFERAILRRFRIYPHQCNPLDGEAR